MPRIFTPVDISQKEKEARKDYFIKYVQLWNRETFLAEAHFAPVSLGKKPGQLEVDFYIVPGAVSMNLSAMAVCTKHGLWQSASKKVAIRKA